MLSTLTESLRPMLVASSTHPVCRLIGRIVKYRAARAAVLNAHRKRMSSPDSTRSRARSRAFARGRRAYEMPRASFLDPYGQVLRRARLGCSYFSFACDDCRGGRRTSRAREYDWERSAVFVRSAADRSISPFAQRSSVWCVEQSRAARRSSHCTTSLLRVLVARSELGGTSGRVQNAG